MRLSTLSLDIDRVSIPDLSWFLKLSRCLEKLTLSREDYIGCSDHSDQQQPTLANAKLRCNHNKDLEHALSAVKHSLKELELPRHNIPDCTLTDDFVGSFKFFSRLVRLSVDLETLCGREVLMASASALADRLPSSLETLELHYKLYDTDREQGLWSTAVSNLVLSFDRPPDLKTISISVTRECATMKCAVCTWTTAACWGCLEADGSRCDLCYESDDLKRVSELCKTAGICLHGPWTDPEHQHSVDHMPVLDFGDEEDEED
jgi:hypothetical protein